MSRYEGTVGCSRHAFVIERAVRSLAWRGDELVDWVGGGSFFTLDGAFHRVPRGWGYDRFDGCVTDASGRWAVVHERTGTAGLLLHDGKRLRELHRSSYRAHAYLYPACLFSGPDGRMLLAHCPEGYSWIDIDDAETGRRLTACDDRRVVDFFHSRLTPSPSGTRLLSAGWVWHPLDAVLWFDVAAALTDPRALDRLVGSEQSRIAGLAEETSATWLDDDTLVVGSSEQTEDADEVADLELAPRLLPNALALLDTRTKRYTACIELGEPPGTLMAVGQEHVVTFRRRPRLVSLRTGRAVHEWNDLPTDELDSSIVHQRPHAVLTLDPPNARFALQVDERIEVVSFDVARLPH
jgi:hypothetical protein